MFSPYPPVYLGRCCVTLSRKLTFDWYRNKLPAMTDANTMIKPIPRIVVDLASSTMPCSKTVGKCSVCASARRPVTCDSGLCSQPRIDYVYKKECRDAENHREET